MQGLPSQQFYCIFLDIGMHQIDISKQNPRKKLQIKQHQYQKNHKKIGKFYINQLRCQDAFKKYIVCHSIYSNYLLLQSDKLLPKIQKIKQKQVYSTTLEQLCYKGAIVGVYSQYLKIEDREKVSYSKMISPRFYNLKIIHLENLSNIQILQYLNVDTNYKINLNFTCMISKLIRSLKKIIKLQKVQYRYIEEQKQCYFCDYSQLPGCIFQFGKEIDMILPRKKNKFLYWRCEPQVYYINQCQLVKTQSIHNKSFHPIWTEAFQIKLAQFNSLVEYNLYYKKKKEYV